MQPRVMRLLLRALAAALLLSSIGEAGPVPSRVAALPNGGLGSIVSCSACRTMLSVVQRLFRLRWSIDLIARVAADICVSLRLENVDSTVCNGVTSLFKVWRCTGLLRSKSCDFLRVHAWWAHCQLYVRIFMSIDVCESLRVSNMYVCINMCVTSVRAHAHGVLRCTCMC